EQRGGHRPGESHDHLRRADHDRPESPGVRERRQRPEAEMSLMGRVASIAVVGAAVLAGALGLAAQDDSFRLRLRDGRMVEGRVVRSSTRELVLGMNGKETKVRLDEIEQIERLGAPSKIENVPVERASEHSKPRPVAARELVLDTAVPTRTEGGDVNSIV